MYDLLERYLSLRKNTYVIIITLATVVLVLVFLLEDRSGFWSSLFFFEPFVLMIAIVECQMRLSEKKQAIIRYVTAQVADKTGLQCKDPGILHEEECKASCFFHSGINAFYLDRDIPRQVFALEKENIVLQLSHVSCGGVKRLTKEGKWFVLRGNAAAAGFKITSTGLLFRCVFPFYFSDTWLLLPKKWGRHLEKITYLNFLVVSFYFMLKKPLNLNLFKNENNTLWIYSTVSSEQEADAAEECSFVEKCYSLLRKKSYSLMSFTGNTMYVYIPFNWKMTSEQKLQDCITEYKANIELVMGIIFDEIMHRYYEQQFVAINDC